eukprot:COSAG02_NODE_61671_length_268_cov_0.603550_1_plen_31_part_10
MPLLRAAASAPLTTHSPEKFAPGRLGMQPSR